MIKNNRPHIDKIKTNSPRAWEKYYNENTKGGTSLKWLSLTNEDLYEFFDSQNIIIEITSNGLNQNRSLNFNYTIVLIEGGAGGVYYNTRPLAEQAAFERAFEILNDML